MSPTARGHQLQVAGAVTADEHLGKVPCGKMYDAWREPENASWREAYTRTPASRLPHVDFFNGFAPAGFGYRPRPLTYGLRINVNM